MFHDLKNLLGESLKRNHIEREVTIAQIIDAVNLALPLVLPPGRAEDARAISWREGIVTVRCANAAAADRLRRDSSVLFDAVKREVPRADLRELRTLIGMREEAGY